MTLDNAASYLSLHEVLLTKIWESLGFERIIEHRLFFLILEEKT